MKLPPSLQGDSLTRLLQGALAGCVATLLLGFGWGGWQLQSKAQLWTDESVSSALVKALTPICVEKFQNGTDAKASLVALKATDSWKQDTFVEEGGWATFPGKAEPYSRVADACARILTDLK
jgi:hypothetical protein